MSRALMLLAVTLMAVGCTADVPATRPPAPSPSPPASVAPAVSASPSAPTVASTPTEAVDHGPIGFLNDLAAAGIEAAESSSFAADPISRLGVLVCVAGEPVQLFVFGSPDEAAAAAAQIDPRDPSRFGTSIVEWAGEPKFWLRDRILVLYLGTESETEEALVSVLGAPFARGQGRPPLPGGDAC